MGNWPATMGTKATCKKGNFTRKNRELASEWRAPWGTPWRAPWGTQEILLVESLNIVPYSQPSTHLNSFEFTCCCHLLSISGWWFQTFFIFPSIGNVIIPTDFHIFQDGRSTTNQYSHSTLITSNNRL